MQDLDHDDQLPPREFFTEFKLNDAWEETKDEFRHGTVKSKATSSAKLIGKSLWNIGLSVAKNLPEHLEKAFWLPSKVWASACRRSISRTKASLKPRSTLQLPA